MPVISSGVLWSPPRLDSTPIGNIPRLGAMSDVRIPPAPGIPVGLEIPGSELSERFSRASGPGGQGVNTTDSRVQLSWDLATSVALNEVQRQRLLLRLASRLTGTVLTLNAAEYRSQRRNRAAARERLIELVTVGLRPPAPSRKRRRPSLQAKQRRLASKRHRSELKLSRRKPALDQ